MLTLSALITDDNHNQPSISYLSFSDIKRRTATIACAT